MDEVREHSAKDLLLYIARNLVEKPDAVTVTEVEGDQELTLELRVDPDDMGKVIGRQGRIAKEIRTLVRSYAQKAGRKVSVDIID
ncbi:MAG: KH domain-containing protein [Oscillibacter sp.]|nr:KH domain-containing protein [Oscillibacter sp.]